MRIIDNIKNCGEEISTYIIQDCNKRFFDGERSDFSIFSVYFKDIYEKVLYDCIQSKRKEFDKNKYKTNIDKECSNIMQIINSLDDTDTIESSMDKIIYCFHLYEKFFEMIDFVDEKEDLVKKYRRDNRSSIKDVIQKVQYDNFQDKIKKFIKNINKMDIDKECDSILLDIKSIEDEDKKSNIRTSIDNLRNYFSSYRLLYSMIEYIKEKQLSVTAYKNSPETSKNIITKFLNDNELSINDFVLSDNQKDKIETILFGKSCHLKASEELANMFCIEHSNVVLGDIMKDDTKIYLLGESNE